MQDYEKLGSFYLGKVYDQETKQRQDEYVMYDAKDLTTHAVCVGMTGSGKTGLCIGLLEEAAMDGVPALVIDPKGDMSNLLLSFPQLLPEDFLPWVQAEEAERKGQTLEEYAASTAAKWQAGLAEWGQDASRIQALHEKADFSIYTPGSQTGRPLSILNLVDLPSAEILEDADALHDYTSSTVSGLLALLGLDADPLNSRDHILLSNILTAGWQAGQGFDLSSLITAIQAPPITQVGVMPLETFYPSKDRFALAMKFNNLLASPQFAAWTKGEPLDIGKLLYTPEGKPRITVLSINHLNDAERMFFVSTFLTRVVSWMRGQSGTSSLRAILYMDEIYGYFPPVANPPSKQPLLTLLKQARAFGLGVVLTTQNPVDLDYKGLSNIGTWFVGRLQTEQDKARLLDGLQGASSEAAAAFDRQKLDKILSNLSARVFLMNNVHEDAPVLFETRWAMSYLAGPLTKNQIAKLPGAKAPQPAASPAPENVAPAFVAQTPAAPTATPTPVTPSAGQAGIAPQLPADVNQYYMPVVGSPAKICYLPSIYAYVSTTFDDAKNKISTVETTNWNAPLKDGVIAVDWAQTTRAAIDPNQLSNQAVPGAIYGALPASGLKKASYSQWEKELVDYLCREQVLTLYKNEKTGIVSQPGESQADFAARVAQEGREGRDQALEKLREKYAKRIDTANEKVRKAEQAVGREQSQAGQAKLNTAINVGSTILDSFLGRKAFGKSTLGKASSTARSAGRVKQQADDVVRANETLEKYQEDLANLEAQLQEELDKVTQDYEASTQKSTAIEMRPKKTNVMVKVCSLLWLPFEMKEGGGISPAYPMEK